MTNRTCPIGLNQCYGCHYRQEVSDCGYQEDNYEQALQQTAKRALIEIERQGKSDPTLLFSGVTTAREFRQALLDAVLGDYRGLGFSLVIEEPLATLYHNGELVFVFGQGVPATIRAIHAACYLHLIRSGLRSENEE